MYVTNKNTRRKSMNVYNIINEVEIESAKILNDYLIKYREQRIILTKQDYQEKVYSLINYEKIYKQFKSAFQTHLKDMKDFLNYLNYDKALEYDLTQGYNDFVNYLDELLQEFIDNSYLEYRKAVDKIMLGTKPTKKQQEIIDYYSLKAIELGKNNLQDLQEQLDKDKQDKYQNVITDTIGVLVGIGINNTLIRKDLITNINKVIDTPTGKWSLANRVKQAFSYNLNMALREQIENIYTTNGVEKVIYRHRGTDTPCWRCEPHVNHVYPLKEALQLIRNYKDGDEWKVVFHADCHCWLVPIKDYDRVPIGDHKEHLKENNQRKKETQEQLNKIVKDNLEN